MAVTIVAGDLPAAAVAVAGRAVVRTSLDVLWVVVDTGSDLEFWFSDDDGATWAEDTSAAIASRNASGMSIDGNNYLHLKTRLGAGTADSYWYGTLNGAHTAVTWTEVAYSGNAMRDGDVVGYVLSGYQWGVAVGWQTSAFRIDGYQHRNGVAYAGLPNLTVSATPNAICLDFHHTGDARTVQGGTPHLYLAWRESTTAYFAKATYSTGTWTWGAIRTIQTGITEVLGIAFDGTRVLILVDSSGALTVYERDAGDTTTTTRAAPALTGGADGAQVSYDTNKDIHIVARDTTGDDIEHIVYDRSAGTWGSWTTLDAGTYTDVDCARGFRSSVIDVVTEDATNVSHTVVELNDAPTAATWVTAAGAHDRDETLPLDWDFEDPDPGDTQSAYALSRVVNGGSTEYYDASGGTWSGSETKNASATTSVTLASAWAADGDAVVYKAKTWDAADTEGVYNAALNVTASVQVNPSITTPADLSTITTNTTSVTWTVSEQTQYRARLYDATGATTLEDSGWTPSTATTHPFAATLADTTDYQVGVQTRNNEGLASDEDTHTFTVDYDEPPTPTVNVTADGDHIDVSITNPTPTGPEPDLDSNGVYVRVAAGGVTDGYRPVAGDGIRVASGVAENGAWVDWAAASGTVYEYLIRAVGDNGTYTDSAWTS